MQTFLGSSRYGDDRINPGVRTTRAVLFTRRNSYRFQEVRNILCICLLTKVCTRFWPLLARCLGVWLAIALGTSGSLPFHSSIDSAGRPITSWCSCSRERTHRAALPVRRVARCTKTRRKCVLIGPAHRQRRVDIRGHATLPVAVSPVTNTYLRQDERSMLTWCSIPCVALSKR